ncbi:MAG TPA: ROK family transcriptional regulator [Candidatus Avipropionibacterium avicola]|uniref:ROK family transcriptional regulator n=1 Tax=Candidatus Avipropionibacterium avicola TaxID=2840701 RepID=A0A9D1GVY1_9ACTN|nr:ROK family transcriptional regulator [Candidatus Avipropionibacterium avicola]
MPYRLTGADTTLVRRWNSRAVLKTLRSGPGTTLTALASAAGLSRQTTAAVLEELSQRGLVDELDPTSGHSGRPARRYRFCSGAGHAVGLSFAPDHVQVIVSDLDATVVARTRQDVGEETPAPERLALAHDLAQHCLRDIGPVWGVGIGTSGVIDREGRVRLSTRIPGWTGLDLPAVVGEWFDAPVHAVNDASLAALAEQRLGSARDASDVVLMLTGHRIGYGFLLDGEVHIGQTGAAGELGKLPYLFGKDPSAVLRRVGRRVTEIFVAARAGDPAACELVDEIARGMARSASVMVMVVNPELVVIAGDYVAGGDLLLDPVREHLSGMCLSVPEVALSALGTDGVALGAVQLALDRIEDSHHLLGPAERM